MLRALEAAVAMQIGRSLSVPQTLIDIINISVLALIGFLS
jgi:hypothetical protein